MSPDNSEKMISYNKKDSGTEVKSYRNECEPAKKNFDCNEYPLERIGDYQRAHARKFTKSWTYYAIIMSACALMP